MPVLRHDGDAKAKLSAAATTGLDTLDIIDPSVEPRLRYRGPLSSEAGFRRFRSDPKDAHRTPRAS